MNKKKERLALSKSRIVEKGAITIGFFTFLSRILGLVRDMVIAKIFGSGMVTDAFFVAFKIPNLLRRLFGEGSLTAAFIPVFSEYLSKDRKEALKLANGFLTIISFLLAIIAVLGVIFAPWIVRLQAYGFGISSYEYKLAVLLTKITFPYVFFICLVAFFMGVLNSFKHFFAPAAAPIFLNLSIISSAFLICPHLKTPIVGLAIGVLIGGFLQLCLQIPWALRYGIKVIPSFEAISHPGIKRIGLLMLPTIFGSAVYQLNQFVGTLLASFLPRGSISWLYYADRLVQFPLGVFAISISNAAFPSLSDHIANNEKEHFKMIFKKALSMTFFVAIPSSVGLILLGEPIITILFERGSFTHTDTVNTNYALMFYSVGLWAYSGIRVLVAAFYAMQNTKTPVKIATIALLANFLLSLIFMRYLKHAGLALGLSVASSIQFFLLLFLLIPTVGTDILKEIAKDIVRFCICAFLMGAIVYRLRTYIPINSDTAVFIAISKLALLVGIGVLSYLVFIRIICGKKIFA
ncbi:MAG: murein biosynthesis integral membrane protein MurJ [Deltaproteobacteria bacterium]|nr:MAG: murein biosynthesis integral membrane protein MurJ [Deltaproteobacteria bacterium]